MRQGVQRGFVGKVVGVGAHLDAVQQGGDQGGVALGGDALIQGVEVVVVKGQAHRQALDDKGGQLGAGAPPLLFGVALDELFVDIDTHQVDGLLLEVFRLGGEVGGALLANFCLRLGGGDDAPHLVEGVHIKGQIVQLALVVGNGGIGVAVELGIAVDIIPHGLVVGVEDMRTVAVNGDAGDILGIDIARNVAALVNDKAGFAGVGGFAGKDGTEQTGTDDQIIIHKKPLNDKFPECDPASFSSRRAPPADPIPTPRHRSLPPSRRTGG